MSKIYMQKTAFRYDPIRASLIINELDFLFGIAELVLLVPR